MSLRYLSFFSKISAYSSIFIFDIPTFEGNFNLDHSLIENIFLELGIYLRNYEEMNEL